jgi:hypothetical protein
MKKLNAKGFAHWVIPALAIAIIGSIGGYMIKQSHAATVSPSPGKGFAVIYRYTTPTLTTQITVGEGIKHFGNNIDKLFVDSADYQLKFCGYPNGTYKLSSTYALVSGKYVSIHDKAALFRTPTVETDTSRVSCKNYINNQYQGTSYQLCDNYQKITLTKPTGTTYVKACTLNNTVGSFIKRY